MTLAERRTIALRVATCGWLLGWYWKAFFYAGHLREAAGWPVDIDTLPSFLRSPAVAIAIYALPIAAAVAIFLERRAARIAGAIALVIAAAIACAHVELFNDATFQTSFWAALWILWLCGVGDEDLERDGPRLARSVVALVFLGGAVGKLNSAYWSGEAFHHLYFLQKDTWPYPTLRKAISPAALRTMATWFSRVVIAGELAMVAGPIAPHRLYVWAACGVIAFMVLISTFYLFSVLAALAGILVAASWLTPRST